MLGEELDMDSKGRIRERLLAGLGGWIVIVFCRSSMYWNYLFDGFKGGRQIPSVLYTMLAYTRIVWRYNLLGHTRYSKALA